jgi:hypothetical protein
MLAESSRTKIRISLALNLAIVLMEIAAALLSMSRNGASMFKFYTEDSNIFAMLACAAYSVCAVRSLKSGCEIPLWVRQLKYMAACCLTVTFVVVIFVLAPMMGADGFRIMLFYSSMLFHHLLCPVAAIISFLLFERGPGFSRRHLRLALLPTVVYAAVTIVLNLTGVLYGPYPFLHVYEQPTYMSAAWCVIIVGGALLIAWLMLLPEKNHKPENQTCG